MKLFRLFILGIIIALLAPASDVFALGEFKLTGVILERVTYYETGLALYRPSILDIAQEQANTFNLDVFWVIQDRLSIKTGVCAPRGRYETKI